MNIVSNLIFHCNNCDANTDESTAAGTSGGFLDAKFTFKGTSPSNHLYMDRSAK